MASHQDSRDQPQWMRPPADAAGLGYYVEVLRERIWIVVITTVLALAGAGAYLFTADKVYEASADILVTPVPSDDPILGSLGLPRASADPTRDVETVASLVTSVDIAERAQELLGTDASPRSLLGDVEGQPVASTNIVSVIASADSPERAADLANAFAQGMVEDRTATLKAQIDTILPQLQERLDSGIADPTAEAELQAQVAQLEVLRAGSDPTIRIETDAVEPLAAASPKPLLTIVGALGAGLVLGIVAAFVAQTLDPRLKREPQLRSRYSLPILGRIPRDSGRRDRPLGPNAIAPPTREAYRTLRANVFAARRRTTGSQCVMVTGSARAEGKTSTAINLAASIALAGNRAILIEADLRRPAIGRALGIEVQQGVVATLLENVSLDEALITPAPFGPNLQLLLADNAGGWMGELFSLAAAQRVLDEAKAMADVVIIDSPPLTAVVDTLPLARAADEVLIVSRLGVTRLDKLQELAELLASNQITPVGFALVGTPPRERGDYYTGAPSAPPIEAEAVEPVPPSRTPEQQPEPERAR